MLYLIKRFWFWMLGRDWEQRWFWTTEWQIGEREVDEHIARGEIETFETGDEFFEALKDRIR